MADMYSSIRGDPADLERIISSLEFENQQYVKEIEKENTLIEAIENQIKLVNGEIIKTEQSTTQLDEDTKRYHKQFTQNRDNIESMKKTLYVLNEHDDALRKKLELTLAKGTEERSEHTQVLEHYQAIWIDYQKKYETFPLARALRQLQSRLQEVTCEREAAAAKCKQMREQLLQLQREGKTFIPFLDINEFILKIAELKIDTGHNIKKLHGKYSECQSLQNQIVQLQRRKQEEKRQEEEFKKQQEEIKRQEKQKAELERQQQEAEQRKQEQIEAQRKEEEVQAKALHEQQLQAQQMKQMQEQQQQQQYRQLQEQQRQQLLMQQQIQEQQQRQQQQMQQQRQHQQMQQQRQQQQMQQQRQQLQQQQLYVQQQMQMESQRINNWGSVTPSDPNPSCATTMSHLGSSRDSQAQLTKHRSPPKILLPSGYSFGIGSNSAPLSKPQAVVSMQMPQLHMPTTSLTQYSPLSTPPITNVTQNTPQPSRSPSRQHPVTIGISNIMTPSQSMSYVTSPSQLVQQPTSTIPQVIPPHPVSQTLSPDAAAGTSHIQTAPVQPAQLNQMPTTGQFLATQNKVVQRNEFVPQARQIPISSPSQFANADFEAQGSTMDTVNVQSSGCISQPLGSSIQSVSTINPCPNVTSKFTAMSIQSQPVTSFSMDMTPSEGPYSSISKSTPTSLSSRPMSNSSVCRTPKVGIPEETFYTPPETIAVNRPKTPEPSKSAAIPNIPMTPGPGMQEENAEDASPFDLEKQLKKIKILACQSPSSGFTFTSKSVFEQAESGEKNDQPSNGMFGATSVASMFGGNSENSAKKAKNPSAAFGGGDGAWGMFGEATNFSQNKSGYSAAMFSPQSPSTDSTGDFSFGVNSGMFGDGDAGACSTNFNMFGTSNNTNEEEDSNQGFSFSFGGSTETKSSGNSFSFF